MALSVSHIKNYFLGTGNTLEAPLKKLLNFDVLLYDDVQMDH